VNTTKVDKRPIINRYFEHTRRTAGRLPARAASSISIAFPDRNTMSKPHTLDVHFPEIKKEAVSKRWTSSRCAQGAGME